MITRLGLMLPRVSFVGSWSTDGGDELSKGVERRNGKVSRFHLREGPRGPERRVWGSVASAPDGRWRGPVGANTAVGSMYYVRLYEAASAGRRPATGR